MIETSWLLMGGLSAPLLGALALLIWAQPWRASSPVSVHLAWVFCVIDGCVVATAIHWSSKGAIPLPPREATGWLILALLPAAAVVESIAAIPRVPSPVRWLLRIALACATPVILLWPYVQHHWTTTQSCVWLASLSASLLALRVGLHLMTRSTSQSDRGPWLAMTMAAGATGVTIMSSGSVSTGQLALTLSLGMAGAWAASMILKVPAKLDGGLAVAATALSGLLIIGHFYAELSGINAILLGLAPLTGWVASLPWVRERPVWQRTIAVVILAALLTAAVTIPTALRAMRESQSKSETYGY
jgi:hypothetical protein